MLDLQHLRLLHDREELFRLFRARAFLLQSCEPRFLGADTFGALGDVAFGHRKHSFKRFSAVSRHGRIPAARSDAQRVTCETARRPHCSTWDIEYYSRWRGRE